MTKTTRRLFAGLILAVCSHQTASAQSLEEDYRRQVTQYVNNSYATRSMLAYGFHDNALNVGYVVDSPGTHYDVLYRLKRGYAYAFVGACDSDCKDIDLAVYGPNGNKIAEHTASDDNPSIWLFIVEDGDYRVRATVPTCNAPVGCYVAVKLMSK